MEDGIFSPHSTNNKVRCVVRTCKRRKDSQPNLRYHIFPKPNKRFVILKNSLGQLEKTDLLKLWKAALDINKVSKYMKVCSIYFLKKDYILSGKLE